MRRASFSGQTMSPSRAGITTEVRRVIDVAARNGEEFMVVEVGSERRSVQLDWLRVIDVNKSSFRVRALNYMIYIVNLGERID